MMTPRKPHPRTQFRVSLGVYTPVEGIRKEYERYRFLTYQIATRVTTELIIRTLLEHVDVLPKPTEAPDAQRHIDVMRIISEYRGPHANAQHPGAAARAEAA